MLEEDFNSLGFDPGHWVVEWIVKKIATYHWKYIIFSVLTNLVCVRSFFEIVSI